MKIITCHDTVSSILPDGILETAGDATGEPVAEPVVQQQGGGEVIENPDAPDAPDNPDGYLAEEGGQGAEGGNDAEAKG